MKVLVGAKTGAAILEQGLSRPLASLSIVPGISTRSRVGRIQRLAVEFPSLSDAPGIRPWKPVQLDRWASKSTTPRKARYAAQLVLALAGKPEDPACGNFDALKAIATWKAGDLEAYLVWLFDRHSFS